MNRNKLKKILQNHIERLNRAVIRIEKIDNRLSKFRLVYFIAAIAMLYFLSGWMTGLAFVIILATSVIFFLILVDKHNKINRSLISFRNLRKINQEHIARIGLHWDEISYQPLEIETKNHPFANDLDIIGKHSLIHLLDTSIFKESSHRLLEWLLDFEPNKKEIVKRQKQVQELVSKKGFRDRLRVIGLNTQNSKLRGEWSNEQMLQWFRSPRKRGYLTSLVVLGVLSFSNILLFALISLGFVNPVYLVVSFLAYIVYYKSKQQLVLGLFDAAFRIEHILDRLKDIFLHLEKFKTKEGSELQELLATYQTENERPSGYIRKTQKIFSKAALQANQILWLVINLTVPWDMFFAWRLEILKGELEPRLTNWLNSFYEIEALNSLANFALLHPEYVNPGFIDSGSSLFKATEIGHPLIPPDQRICNDFVINKGQDLFLITGSNMAGKSTFLRTVGINLILAYSGAPICANNLQTGIYRVFSSINITDSLDDGFSHFYTEVRRLRFLLNELENDNKAPLFFFVDEIYRGTNNRERFTGSAAFLKRVAGKKGIGLVSSHDLELAELHTQIPQLVNLHFVELIKNNKMYFEYKLKNGPCPSTNALEIMKMEGLPT